MKYIIYSCLILVIVFQILLSLYYRKHKIYDIKFIAAEIGAGKSCLAVKIALDHLKRKWNVYSNEYIRGTYILRREDIIQGKIYPVRSLLIFDETGVQFNSRQFKTLDTKIIEYFKKCRHYKNKVIFISQTFSDTDKQLRDLSSSIIFVRGIIKGLLSMQVKVKAKLSVDTEGQPTLKYKIAKFGKFYILPKYFKYFNSFEDKDATVINELW